MIKYIYEKKVPKLRLYLILKSEWILLHLGTKQGYVLSLLLSNVVLESPASEIRWETWLQDIKMRNEDGKKSFFS